MSRGREANLLGAVALLGLLSIAAARVAGQQKASPRVRPAPASITGRVVVPGAAGPLRYSLVYLVRTDSAVRVGAALTDADGGFLFRGVRPGRYRLELERAGLEAEPGRPFVLAAGERYQARLTSSPRPVAIAPVVVSGQACYGAGQLDEEPTLAALWREATKAAEARRLFDEQYRYAVTVRQLVWEKPYPEGVQRVPGGRTRAAGERVVVNDPARPGEHGGDPGFALELPTRMRLTAPDLPELGPTFLRSHCLVVEADRAAERRIGFRPAFADSGRVDIRGSIVLDSALAVQRLELSYLIRSDAFAEGVLYLAELPVLGARLRFASRLDAHSLRRAGTFVWEGRVRIEDYRDFAPAGPPPTGRGGAR